MDIEEAARHLGVSTKTLRRWVAQGKLQARRVVIPTGTRLEFDPQDLENVPRESLHPEVLDRDLDMVDTPQPSNDGQCPIVDTTGHDTPFPSRDVQASLPVVSRSQTLAIFEDLAKAFVRAMDTTGHGRAADVSRSRQLGDLPDLLTVEEVADYLRVGKDRVRELLRSEKLRGIRGMGRGWRIKRENLQQFIEEL